MSGSSVTAFLPLADLLPKVGGRVSAASRLLHNRQLRSGWRRALGGLDFAPLAGRPADAVQRVSVQTQHGVAAAYFSAPDFPSVDVAASHAASVPAALQQLAAEALMQPLLEALRSVGLADVAVIGLAPVEGRFDEVPAAGWVRVLRDGEPVASFICIELPDAAMREIAQQLQPPGFASRMARALALRGHVTLATRAVRRSVLGSLLPGDVLLLASGGVEQRVDCSVSFGARGARRWSAAASVDETSLTIQGAGRMVDDDDDLESQADDASAAAGDSPPHDIEVPVRFEIDTVPLPLAEIEAMSSGYVIELAVPLSAAQIKLVACGRVIGVADLVAVGDRLGARITHMVTRDAARHVD
jgi:type III secretion protein Q